MKRFSFLPTILFCLLLWVVASLPGGELHKVQQSPQSFSLRFFLSDPVMHFLTFGLLSLLLCGGYYGAGRPIPFLKVAGFTAGYGLLIEVYQAILPWRDFGLDDLFWNITGAACSLVLIKWQLGPHGWVAKILRRRHLTKASSLSE